VKVNVKFNGRKIGKAQVNGLAWLLAFLICFFLGLASVGWLAFLAGMFGYLSLNKAVNEVGLR